MSRKVRVVYEVKADGPVAVAAYSSATAVGENTLATSQVSVEMNSHGCVTLTSGTSTATASASSPTGETAYATADTGVVSNSDILRTSTTTTGSGETDDWSWWVESSTTKFFSVDIDGIDIGVGRILIDVTKDQVVVSQPETVDGNIAALDVEATVFGSNTYAAVEAEVLAVENQLSSTNVTVLTASDYY